MNSFAEVIERLGIGPTASALGLNESHVRTMKTRDSIPPTYFAPLVESEAGREHGLSFELLHRLHQANVSKRSKPTSDIASEKTEAA